MKNIKVFLKILIVSVVLFCACEKERCNEGYQTVNVNGQDICVLKFNIGINFPIENGSKLYHQKQGIIEFSDGKWINQFGENITPLILPKK